jgi:hypothetical protein
VFYSQLDFHFQDRFHASNDSMRPFELFVTFVARCCGNASQVTRIVNIDKYFAATTSECGDLFRGYLRIAGPFRSFV